MILAGFETRMIASQLGLSRTVVEAKRTAISACGYNVNARWSVTVDQKRVGTAAQLWDMLTPEEKRWLQAGCPDDVTICEYVAAIVSDAYHDDLFSQPKRVT